MVSSLLKELMMCYEIMPRLLANHSRSARPISPTLIPFDDWSRTVLGQSANVLSSPRPGSRTFARSHGKLH